MAGVSASSLIRTPFSSCNRSLVRISLRGWSERIEFEFELHFQVSSCNRSLVRISLRGWSERIEFEFELDASCNGSSANFAPWLASERILTTSAQRERVFRLLGLTRCGHGAARANCEQNIKA